MKIKYLGTAAAEGIPAIFCECANCKRSRMLGGKNIRTRSQAIIDDVLLIDFPAVVYDDFVKIAAEHSFLVSYDGMELEF